MQATPSPSALAASDELSQAPVCQGGRAHGVYAPVHDEEASDAVHDPLAVCLFLPSLVPVASFPCQSLGAHTIICAHWPKCARRVMTADIRFSGLYLHLLYEGSTHLSGPLTLKIGIWKILR